MFITLPFFDIYALPFLMFIPFFDVYYYTFL